MPPQFNRRDFMVAGSLGAAGWASVPPSRSEGQDDSPAAIDFPRDRPGPSGPLGSPTDRGRLVPGLALTGDVPVRVISPHLEDLPWRDNEGVKEFHLVAQHVEREILPDKWYNFWGFNGGMPGPTIQATAGDRIRIIVRNELPESTVVHWHGLEVPAAMDGVDYLSQPPIPPGEEFVYEFDLHQNGTFFYHSHGPMQQAIGMVGMLIVHPRQAFAPMCDHDFAMLTQQFALLPKGTVPDTMSEVFNLFTLNGRAAPYVNPMIVRLGQRIRIRFVNLSTMDHHPMHVHGHTFWVTGTEGGRIPDTAWVPGNTVLVGVGQSRDVEFIANNPGDWMVHCHIPHHMMNHMVPHIRPDAQAPHHGHNQGHGAAWEVPGYPQDMMDLAPPYDAHQVAQLQSGATRGMRPDWYRGLMGMATVLRVLPDEQYEQYLEQQRS